MKNSALPEGFEELDRFVPTWALPLESERNRRRITSSMDDLNVFYNAMLPRMDEVVSYLNQFELDALPEDAQRLLYLAFALMEIAQPVEVLGRPDMPDSVEYDRLKFTFETQPKPRRRSGST